MERLKRKLKNRGVHVVECSKETYQNKSAALERKTGFNSSDEFTICDEFASFSAILAVDESAMFYLDRKTFNDLALLPEGHPTTISIYENNIFESIEIASFFIQNSIPKNQLPLRNINPAELSNLYRVYIVKN
ncbi:hypothetical protein AB6T38_08045 [Aliiglaciecola sp. SL4]|uniref:hypothetical protein n=1 Tax=Aliiglaciecola sp. SL4 TaxID=3239806 RepID=UPI00355B894E